MTSPEPPSVHSVFRALGDPTRLAIVDRLSIGPASLGELAAAHRMSLSGLLKHVRILERSGLVVGAKEGRIRIYRIGPAGIETLDTWFRAHRDLWGGGASSERDRPGS